MGFCSTVCRQAVLSFLVVLRLFWWLPPSHNVDVSGESGEGGRRTLGASAYGLRPCCSLGNCKFQDYGLFLFYVSCQQGIDTYPVRGLVPLVTIFLQGVWSFQDPMLTYWLSGWGLLSWCLVSFLWCGVSGPLPLSQEKG